ncbi:MAG: hypothetical protein CMA06_00325 [Euryarchaeota archaeon]|nr:hypothetical protein [Euryarchaeota archaeon]MDC0040442.1 hypothetical protein [Candidatus Poseidoniales archaeon]|tara:strand:- start:31 stop:405 length:375 start_codon:yes stop_codon:yes gene_type:complete
MTSKSPESTDEEDGPPRMLSRSEESEASFWRLKRSSDEWRENRVKRVLAQEEESLFTTLGRMSFLTICILFDGVFLLQIPVTLGKSFEAWVVYFMLLYGLIRIQHKLYQRWFSLDISQIHFENP